MTPMRTSHGRQVPAAYADMAVWLRSPGSDQRTALHEGHKPFLVHDLRHLQFVEPLSGGRRGT